MKHHYEIPRVEIRRPHFALWLCGVGLLLLVFTVRHLWFIISFQQYRVMTTLWLMFFLITGFQWAASWLERPFEVDGDEQHILDELRVTVCIPIFNEDPVVLDRVLYSLFTQTRLPNRVQIVDDGSKVDYHEVRGWWQGNHPAEVEFSWVRQPHLGKKHAQAQTFRDTSADVVVTVDSDTVLERRALAEGLKPFADARVQSVAGLELAWNHDWNLMTRLNSTRQLVWQLVTCSAQSVMRGNVLVNRGTFALYRGKLVRDVLPGYLGETFWGRPIRLGDDTFLTTLALCRGRAVQQPSAVCLTMYPENLSHHIRQWTRWMRGTTLRTFWRIRYLRVSSWGWLYTILNLWLFLGSLALTGLFVALWPRSASYAQALVAATIIWSWSLGTRILVVRRSDQDLLGRIGAAMLAPAAALWVLAVLRVVRVYGTLTFLRQRWTTRSDVEIRANLSDTTASQHGEGSSHAARSLREEPRFPEQQAPTVVTFSPVGRRRGLIERRPATRVGVTDDLPFELRLGELLPDAPVVPELVSVPGGIVEAELGHSPEPDTAALPRPSDVGGALSLEEHAFGSTEASESVPS